MTHWIVIYAHCASRLPNLLGIEKTQFEFDMRLEKFGGLIDDAMIVKVSNFIHYNFVSCVVWYILVLKDICLLLVCAFSVRKKRLHGRWSSSITKWNFDEKSVARKRISRAW